MFEQPLTTDLSLPLQELIFIIIFYFLAILVNRVSGRVARRLMRLSRFAPKGRRPSASRQNTLHGLYSGAITFFAFALATLFSLSIFIDAQTLVWMVGLFSTAFGLGARPLFSDFLTGISFIFEDTFEVGEKVELLGLPGGSVEGVIEEVNLRTTLVRATSGEPYQVPNGEIRVVRNFSRGRFSEANIKIKIPSSDLNIVLPLLEQLGHEAITLLPNLLEPWKIISETGEIGQLTELTLVAKARFGNAAEMRPRLLTLVQERLEEANIALG